MRLAIMAGVLALGISAAVPVLAEDAANTPGQTSAGTPNQVTGIVTRVDRTNQTFTIDGQKYFVGTTGGPGLLPEEGDTVGLTYRDENGQRLVTRIGQAPQ